MQSVGNKYNPAYLLHGKCMILSLQNYFFICLLNSSWTGLYLLVFYADCFSCKYVAQLGSWPSNSLGFKITNNDTPQFVGLLGMSSQLLTETST